MKHKCKITNGCYVWTGPTMKAAQASRDADLNRLFAEHMAEVPTVVFGQKYDPSEGYVPYTLVIFRQDPNGLFGYRIYERETPWSVHGAYGTKQMAEFSGRRHLAQQLFVDETHDGAEVIHIDDTVGTVEHARWVSWQLAYRKARDEGKTDEEARALASAA